MLAGDHSTAGAVIGGTLKRDGFQGLVRYAAEGRGNVSITPAEIRDLKANGIPVAIVCEHEANWLLHTDSVAGRVLGARDIARACGLPDGVVYLAGDFDATNGGPTSPGSPGDLNMQTVERSLNAAAAVLGRENVGFYGSYFAIDWLVQHGWTDIKFWQTAAWSRGLLHPNAVLYQRASSMRVAGVDVDIDAILHPEWGQRVAAARRRRNPVKRIVQKVKSVHPKVAAASVATIVTSALVSLAATEHVQITPVEKGTIYAAVVLIVGYLVPQKKTV